MPSDAPSSGGLTYRLGELQGAVKALEDKVDRNTAAIAHLEDQVAGENGLIQSVNSLRKGAYWVAGIIVASSIGFAFSVLRALGHV